MQLTPGLFLGIGAASLRGYLAASPQTAPKTRAAYSNWRAEESGRAIQEAIIAALGALGLETIGLCNPARFPGACQFGWGYAAVSTIRWIGNF